MSLPSTSPCFHPIRFSATLLINNISPRVFVVMTPSPILRKVTARRFLSAANFSSAFLRISAFTNISPTIFRRAIVSSAQIFSFLTISKPKMPTRDWSYIIGTSINDLISCAFRISFSAPASGGRFFIHGMCIISKLFNFFIHHGKISVSRPWRFSIRGSIPSAHHSWVLSILSRESSENWSI